MDSSCNIVVTGAYGLVGHAIQWAVKTQSDANFGRRNGENWIFLARSDGDLRDYEATARIFEKYRPYMVIHLAARVGGMYQNDKEPVDFMRDNLLIDQNVLELARIHEVQKVVSCLSTCIFPDETIYPINESMLHNGPPHESNFGYAYAKRMLDVSNRAYAKQYGCNFTSVIPTNVFGPFDNFGEGCHFLPSLIKRVHDAKGQDAKSITLLGSGKALRQFIYSRDLAKLIIWTLRHYQDYEPLILSGDQSTEVSIQTVTETMCSLAAFSGSIEWDTTKSDGQLKKTADSSKLRKLLPYFEFTSMEDGLRQTLIWYAEQRKAATPSRTLRSHRL
ncbi:putative GDP-L-fucose synthetase [Paraphoma chrysanthemicola]|nr:putative GDP-L-fucose synthetase [Paraphoma chrysanthemicola]